MALKVLHRFGEKTSYGNWDMLLLERYRYLSLFKLPNACKRERDREMKKDNKMGVYIAFYFFFSYSSGESVEAVLTRSDTEIV